MKITRETLLKEINSLLDEFCFLNSSDRALYTLIAPTGHRDLSSLISGDKVGVRAGILIVSNL